MTFEMNLVFVYRAALHGQLGHLPFFRPDVIVVISLVVAVVIDVVIVVAAADGCVLGHWPK